MTSRFLTTNFENTQSLIETNPQNEDTIINDYINMIIENKNNSRFVRSATYRDSGGINNMPNIKIMNNFQRYGPDGYEQPIFIPTTTATIVSTSNLANAPPVSLTGAGTSINSNLANAPPASLTGAGTGGNVGLGTTSAPPPQSFRNRETFQNYYNNYINGGFKEYYHI